jgi:hypothetical protein
VKHFGPIDTLRKRTFPRENWYEAGIWGKRTFAIEFMLGCDCLPGQTIIEGRTRKSFCVQRANRIVHKPINVRPLFSRTSILPGNRLVIKSRVSKQGAI